MNQLLEKLCALLGAFALAFTLSGLITSYLGQIVFVKGSSMEHTLKNRDILLVRKWGKYRRGEVVICHYPKRVERAIHIGAALTLSRDTVFVKRLVALPGDTVKFHAAPVTFVNGKLQRVVSRITPCAPCQTFVPRFNGRRINHRGPYAGLQHHGVETGSLQPVQNVA